MFICRQGHERALARGGQGPEGGDRPVHPVRRRQERRGPDRLGEVAPRLRRDLAGGVRPAEGQGARLTSHKSDRSHVVL